MVTATYYDRHVQRLFSVVEHLALALAAAGIEYRLVGGFAVYLHVNARDETAARLTRDIDVAVRRADLERIRSAVEPAGFRLRPAGGVDLLTDELSPKRSSAVHFVFSREKVRADYLTSVPEISPSEATEEGFPIAPVADLVRMKLTSFRLKDQVHIQDMDAVGLFTAEIEESLPQLSRERLLQVREAV